MTLSSIVEVVKSFNFVYGSVAGLVVGLIAGVLIGRLGGKHSCGCGRGTRNASSRQSRRSSGAVSADDDRPQVGPGEVEIYVGNLSYDMTDDSLRGEFAKYGEVRSARIITNRFTSRSKGFGFVIMPNRPEAEKAIEALHEAEILGRKLRVNEARNSGKGRN